MTVSIIIPIVSAIIAIIGTLVTFGKNLFDIGTGKKSLLREEYKIAKEFYTDLGLSPESQPIVIERGYRALAGYRDLDVSEIKYILEFQNPDKALLAYAMGLKLLTYDVSANRIIFKKKWLINHRHRYYIQKLSICSYFVFAFIGIMPLTFHILNTPISLLFFKTHYLLPLPLLAPAFLGLWFSEEIVSANKFIKIQESQIPRN